MPEQKRFRKLTWQDLAAEMQIVGATNKQGWTTVRVPGWETFKVSVRVGTVDGYPRLLGLRLDPDLGRSAKNFDACILTTARLKSFPLQAVADVLDSPSDAKARRARRKLSGEDGKPLPVDRKSDLRQVTTVDAVVKAYKADTTGAPRQHVVDTLHISTRTATRYIQMARDMGLLQPERPRRRNSETSGTSRKSKKKG